MSKKLNKKIISYHIDAFSDKAIDTIGAGDAVLHLLINVKNKFED